MFLYIFGIYSQYATFIRENYTHKVILDFSWNKNVLKNETVIFLPVYSECTFIDRLQAFT